METIIPYITTHAGEIALTMAVASRLANLTPTQWDNKFLDAVFGFTYRVFTIFGVKIPNIESVVGGKVTVTK